jgi:bud site selection protein 31
VTATVDPHEGKRKCEAVWPILRIHHQRTRFVFDAFYRKREISRELYEFLLREKYADAALIARWKKVRTQSHIQKKTKTKKTIPNSTH